MEVERAESTELSAVSFRPWAVSLLLFLDASVATSCPDLIQSLLKPTTYAVEERKRTKRAIESDPMPARYKHGVDERPPGRMTLPMAVAVT
jgi:hypothetical protein